MGESILPRRTGAATALTPGYGHIIGFPFAWVDRGDNYEKKDRPCLALRLKGGELVLMALTNPKHCHHRNWNVMTVKWLSMKMNQPEMSYLALGGLQANVVPEGTIPIVDQKGNSSVWGTMTPGMLAVVEQFMWNGIGDGSVKPIRGARWVEQSVYQRMTIEPAPNGGVRMRDIAGQVLGLV